ncbi:MAG: hypothetical protein OEY18_14190 [Candidatus Aminicenantes bacterium]|nr:hypothetical protein [Candidatus Aminicenantes bacterium]MDH5385846.1 hypothetical protein [Candidatus Aminicenantes bacterium]MDH5742596.1 hypothetical protein [Candidatus Aminicenantes bacterium]
MEKTIEKEIKQLREEIDKKRKEIRDIKQLVNKEIDRDFFPPLEELSEKELEPYFDKYLSLLEASLDPHPDEKSLISHRKILGKPIILVKRILLRMTGVYTYTSLFLEKQKNFNQQSFALYRALLGRLRKNTEKIKHIEERIIDCEVNLMTLSKKLKDLSNHQFTAKDE